MDVSDSSFEAALQTLVRTIVRQELAALDPPDPVVREYLSTRDAAALAAVSQGTVRRWIREGRLQACGAGREIRVQREELETLMHSGRRCSKPGPTDLGTIEALATRELDRVYGKTRTDATKSRRTPR